MWTFFRDQILSSLIGGVPEERFHCVRGFFCFIHSLISRTAVNQEEAVVWRKETSVDFPLPDKRKMNDWKLMTRAHWRANFLLTSCMFTLLWSTSILAFYHGEKFFAGHSSRHFFLLDRKEIWLVHVWEYPRVTRRRCTRLISSVKFSSVGKMACGVVFFVVLAFVPAGIFANKVEDDEETCRRYANGQVYPEKTTISEHAVHWSKAQSKSEFTNHNVALSPFSDYQFHVFAWTLKNILKK